MLAATKKKAFQPGKITTTLKKQTSNIIKKATELLGADWELIGTNLFNIRSKINQINLTP